MNWRAVWAIYRKEMARTFRTILQSLVSPVISTALYFVVFGTAIGGRIEEVEGIAYGAFIVPGLIMLTVLMQSVSNASFGIYFPKFVGTIYELLSAPISYLEIVIGFVGAAATKSMIIGLIIYRDRQPLRDPAGGASGLDARLPRAHLHQLQPVRLHHRHLGEELRAAAAGADADHHAAGLPRRQLLLDLHAAAGLADDHPLQPGGLPGLRLPLVVLRHRRRRASASASRRSPASPLACLAVVWWIFRTGYKIRS